MTEPKEKRSLSAYNLSVLSLRDRHHVNPPDIEAGGLRANPVPVRAQPDDSRMDLNSFQQKKTLSLGLMDIALLAANCGQLRYVLVLGPGYKYYYANIGLISVSLTLQLIVGVILFWHSKFNINNERHIGMAHHINNGTVLGIFGLAFLNVFITAFAL